ncbi:MAG: YkgJ family cysteine cluster protein [Rhodospirillaceae bacterium]|nr:YkgJ family cysteine cluster protein [Rhodospirillaceae bacterium]
MTADPNTPEGAAQLFGRLNEEERAALRELHDETRAHGRTGLAAAKAAQDTVGQANGSAAAHLAAVHMGMAEFLQVAYRASYDNALADRLIKPVACTSGCAFCCYLSVEVTIFGAVAIASFIAASRPDFAQPVRDTAPKVAGLSALQRSARQVACAFLQKDNTCGIYAVRPMSCGAYFSFDASVCEQDRKTGGTSGNIPVYGWPGVLNSMITGGLSAACEDEGLQSCTVELLSAVALILDDSTAVPRWLAGQQVFTPYRHV